MNAMMTVSQGERVEAQWLDQADWARWDEMVTAHPLGRIYHLSSWSRALQSSFSHYESKLLGIRGSDGKQIIGGIPLVVVRSWLLGNRIVSVPFASYCDPLVQSASEFSLLWPYLLEVCESAHCKRIELKSAHPPPGTEGQGFAVNRFFRHHFLELNQPLKQLQKRFSQTAVRHMLVKAQRAKIQIKTAAREEDLNIFYQLLIQTRKRLKLPQIPRRFFANLLKFLGPRRCQIRTAFFEGHPAAAMLTLRFKGTLSIEYAADNPKFRKMGANQLLYWNVIEESYSEGLSRVSFGRASPNNEGLLAYKRRWGTTEEDLGYLVFPPARDRKALGVEAIPGSGLFRQLFGCLPSAGSRQLGEFCYRHLG